MARFSFTLSCFTVVSTLLAVAPAAAQQPAPAPGAPPTTAPPPPPGAPPPGAPPPAQPAAEDELKIVTFGIGALGRFGGNFLDKPDDQSVTPPAGVDCNSVNCAADPQYPGFAGLSTGGGFFLEVRFVDEWIGIEFDVLRTSDKGEADLSFTNLTTGKKSQATVEIAHGAWHLPLLIKGTIPGTIAQPQAFLGPEFVFPSGEDCTRIDGSASDECGEVSISGQTAGKTFGAFVESYTMFTFGLGVEFKLPLPIDFMSVRIPLQLRGSVDPGVSGKRIERSKQSSALAGPNVELLAEEYSTRWKFQAVAAIGASVFF